MGFSETVDSSKLSNGRSHFSQTCNLLSQYLKENRSFGDLTLGLINNNTESISKVAAPTGTLDLLPMIEKSQRKPESAPLTIFYNGQVLVFNDFPAAKAEQIMMLASKSSVPTQNHQTATVSPPRAAQSPAESTTSMEKIVPSFAKPSLPTSALGSDLPIARKNSLARFLEKRKDRKAAAAPYQVVKPAAAKSWLGLAPENINMHMQRN